MYFSGSLSLAPGTNSLEGLVTMELDMTNGLALLSSTEVNANQINGAPAMMIVTCATILRPIHPLYDIYGKFESLFDLFVHTGVFQ